MMRSDRSRAVALLALLLAAAPLGAQRRGGSPPSLPGWEFGAGLGIGVLNSAVLGTYEAGLGADLTVTRTLGRHLSLRAEALGVAMTPSGGGDDILMLCTAPDFEFCDEPDYVAGGALSLVVRPRAAGALYLGGGMGRYYTQRLEREPPSSGAPDGSWHRRPVVTPGWQAVAGWQPRRDSRLRVEARYVAMRRDGARVGELIPIVVGWSF